MSLTANKSLDSLHHTEGEVKKKNYYFWTGQTGRNFLLLYYEK